MPPPVSAPAPTPLNADQAKQVIGQAIAELEGKPPSVLECMKLSMLIDHLYSHKSLVVVHWPR